MLLVAQFQLSHRVASNYWRTVNCSTQLVLQHLTQLERSRTRIFLGWLQHCKVHKLHWPRNEIKDFFFDLKADDAPQCRLAAQQVPVPHHLLHILGLDDQGRSVPKNQPTMQKIWRRCTVYLPLWSFCLHFLRNCSSAHVLQSLDVCCPAHVIEE